MKFLLRATSGLAAAVMSLITYLGLLGVLSALANPRIMQGPNSPGPLEVVGTFALLCGLPLLLCVWLGRFALTGRWRFNAARAFAFLFGLVLATLAFLVVAGMWFLWESWDWAHYLILFITMTSLGFSAIFVDREVRWGDAWA